MIKNIVFDMGNVLIPYDARLYVNKCTSSPEDRRLLLEEVFRSVEWARQDRGTITLEAAIESVCARVPPHLHPAVAALFGGWYEDLAPYPEMEALVRRLKANGYGIYLLSNTGKAFYQFRDRIPALQYFDGQFASCDWHLVKPNEAIYLTFCAHFSLRPESCFFIDDAPSNVEGAQTIGMEGFVYHGSTKKLVAALGAAGIRLDERPL